MVLTTFREDLQLKVTHLPESGNQVPTKHKCFSVQAITSLSHTVCTLCALSISL